jgi:undecaprenyl phosphate N,N'-diacetylbacillosamine 1-phosphate transferase
MMYNYKLKRSVDFLVSLIFLVLSAPIILIAIISVRLTSPGPVFFRQARVGRNEKKFEILKFRTMYEDSNRNLTQTRQGDPGVTMVGAVLRRIKIDELPQLVNVLRGEMSLIGPRPCLPQTAQDIPDWARKRFQVSPGLTGLAQVNGNIGLSWEERWLYDVAYAEQINFWLDVKILFKTVIVVLAGEEIFRRSP